MISRTDTGFRLSVVTSSAPVGKRTLRCVGWFHSMLFTDITIKYLVALLVDGSLWVGLRGEMGQTTGTENMLISCQCLQTVNMLYSAIYLVPVVTSLRLPSCSVFTG